MRIYGRKETRARVFAGSQRHAQFFIGYERMLGVLSRT